VQATGPQKLAVFLARNEIPKRKAARDLKVSAPTILDWLSGSKAPSPPHRAAIRVWTNGEIVETDWATAREREQTENASEVRPFEPEPPKALSEPPPAEEPAPDSQSVAKPSEKSA
jgi:hypothetical protein